MVTLCTTWIGHNGNSITERVKYASVESANKAKHRNIYLLKRYNFYASVSMFIEGE
jgi:hypothetical protein